MVMQPIIPKIKEKCQDYIYFEEWTEPEVEPIKNAIKH